MPQDADVFIIPTSLSKAKDLDPRNSRLGVQDSCVWISTLGAKMDHEVSVEDSISLLV